MANQPKQVSQNTKDKKVNSLKNIRYMFGLIYDASPHRLLIGSIKKMNDGIFTVLFTVYLIQYIFECVEDGQPFNQIAFFLVILCCCHVFIHICTAGYEYYVLRNNPIIFQSIYRKVIRKANTMPLEKFEQPNYYNKYARALEEAQVRAESVMLHFTEIMQRIASLLTISILICQWDPVILSFPLIPFCNAFVINRVRSKLIYCRNNEMTADKRRAEYCKRIFYERKYAGEIRLFSIKDRFLSIHKESYTNMVKIQKTYFIKLSFLDIWDSLFSKVFLLSFCTLYATYRILVQHSLSVGIYVSLMAALTNLAKGVQQILEHVGALATEGKQIENIRIFLEEENNEYTDNRRKDKDSTNEATNEVQEKVIVQEERKVSRKEERKTNRQKEKQVSRKEERKINKKKEKQISRYKEKANQKESVLCQENRKKDSQRIQLDHGATYSLLHCFHTLTLSNVTYQYVGAKNPVIQDLSMTIHRGEKIALVGHNGAGKTTLVKLLMGLYQVSKGTICYNDTNINEIDKSSYRNRFATIFQDFQVYALSIASNVIMHEPRTKEEEEKVIKALKQAGLYEKIVTLKEGIHSIVTHEFSEEGVLLSGGEIQKIALARVFINEDVDFVILDEPSSALDPISEFNLYQNMMKAAGEKTVIFISHRLSSARMADKIYMLEQGKIIEAGNHEELMQQNGKYAAMFRIQAKNYVDQDMEFEDDWGKLRTSEEGGNPL